MTINFGENLEKALQLRGVKQAWLADKANQKEATISRYVNGVNKSPKIEILVEIAKALNVSTDFLLGLSDSPVAKYDITQEEALLLSAFRRASERDNAIVWQVLESYLTAGEKGYLPALEQSEENVG